VREVVRLSLVILGYFGALLVLAPIAGTSFHQIWRFAGVPVLPRPFADLNIITEAAESGLPYETLIANKYVTGRLDQFDLPRLGLILARKLGLRSRFNFVYGCVLAIAFFGASLFLLKDARGHLWWLAPVLLCSPAVMLAVERGNSDLVMFCLIVLGLWLSSARSNPATVAGFASFLVACVLKLYPFAALPAFFQRSRRGVIAILMIFSIYCIWTAADIRTILANLPSTFRLSYGCHVIGDSLLNIVSHLSPDVGLSHLQQAFSHQGGAVLAVMLTGLCVFRGWQLGHFIPASTSESERENGRSASFERAAFIAGSSIYAATFLTGNSFDYRLIFLLLTVPQIVRWRVQSDRRWIYRAIVPLVIVCWTNVFVASLPAARWLPLRGLAMISGGLAQWVLLAFLVTASAALFRSGLKAEVGGVPPGRRHWIMAGLDPLAKAPPPSG